MKRASFLATAGILGSLLVLPAPSLLTAPSTAQAATTTAAAGYSVTSGHATRLAQSPGGVSGLAAVQLATSPFLDAVRGMLPSRAGAGSAAANAAKTAAPSALAGRLTTVKGAAAKTATAKAATATPATVSGSPSRGTIHAFNGVSDKVSQALIDSPITPPDQGLCVGRDTTLKGSPDAVWEPVNEAAQETTANGAKLRPDVSLATIFQDQYSTGDVRCLYDQSTQTFYFTEIGFPVATGPASDGNNTTVDVAVVNSKGAAEYQFDTSLSGACFGDQPKTGFDNNALVVSTDEYCGPTESDYEGAIAVVISKPQLAAEDATVNDAVLGPVSLAGDPVTGLDPAIDTGSGTGYFVNSVAFSGASQNIVASDNTLGLWTLANTASVTTGKGTPSLTGKVLGSETYAYPVPASSTGNGSTTLADGNVITSETAIQADDDRMSGPVNVTPARGGGVDLWTNVDSALVPRGDTATRDGDAWFEISTARHRVVSQGYVAVKGAYLVYPAVEALPGGPVVQVFTITSPAINPSVAYNKLGSPEVTTVESGTGPHVSFSDAPPFNESRWGDYSFAVPDPNGSGIWLATEYIPPAADQSPDDNWGTYVFEVPAR